MTLEGLDDQRSIGESQSLQRFSVLPKSQAKTNQHLSPIIMTRTGAGNIPGSNHGEGGDTHGSRDISSGNSFRRSIEEVECRRFTDLSNDLGSDSKG